MSEAEKIVKVAKVINQYKVLLNIGSEHGVSIGDDYIIFRIGEEVFDPDTDESLGAYEEVIGRGTVTHLQPKLATLESSEEKPSGRKVIKKYGNGRMPGFGIASIFAGPTEEVVEENEAVMRPFSHAQVGDSAKRGD